MKNFTKKVLESGAIHAIPRPSLEELNKYYRDLYYQESDGKKTTYDSTYSSEELAHKVFESKLAIQSLEEYQKNHKLSDQPKLLELGCGEGFFINEVDKKKWKFHGIDFSSFGIAKWHPHLETNCSFGDIQEFLENGTEQFNICVLKNVLEHVLDPDKILDLVKKRLTKDGLLLITVPNDFSALQKCATDNNYIDREFWFCPPDHLNYFNTENIAPYLKEHNLEIVDAYSSFPVDFFLFHEGSNYIKDRTLGKAAHFARIKLDLLMQQKGLDKVLNMYRSMFECGVGRDITLLMKKI